MSYSELDQHLVTVEYLCEHEKARLDDADRAAISAVAAATSDLRERLKRAEDRLSAACEALWDGRDTLMTAAEDHCEGRYKEAAERLTDAIRAAEGRTS